MRILIAILWCVMTILVMGITAGLVADKPTPQGIGCLFTNIGMCLWSLVNYHAVVAKD